MRSASSPRPAKEAEPGPGRDRFEGEVRDVEPLGHLEHLLEPLLGGLELSAHLDDPRLAQQEIDLEPPIERATPARLGKGPFGVLDLTKSRVELDDLAVRLGLELGIALGLNDRATEREDRLRVLGVESKEGRLGPERSDAARPLRDGQREMA